MIAKTISNIYPLCAKPVIYVSMPVLTLLAHISNPRITFDFISAVCASKRVFLILLVMRDIPYDAYKEAIHAGRNIHAVLKYLLTIEATSDFH